jgi:molybdopterin-binding protein
LKQTRQHALSQSLVVVNARPTAFLRMFRQASTWRPFRYPPRVDIARELRSIKSFAKGTKGETGMKSSVRNRLEGKVTAILRGSAMSEIEIETAAGLVSAVITSRSLDEVGLKVGDKVSAAFKATSVFVDKL